MHNLAHNPNTEPIELQENPAAPVDCKVAKRLPAETALPIDAIQPAAHDPAAIPEDVKPSRGRTAAPATKPPTPIAARQEA